MVFHSCFLGSLKKPMKKAMIKTEIPAIPIRTAVNKTGLMFITNTLRAATLNPQNIITNSKSK